MLTLLMLMIVPVIIALIAILWFTKEVTWLEFGIQLGIIFVIMLGGLGICYFNSTADIELLNGVINDKKREVVSCSHSYSCNCITVSCGKDCNTTICSTCYEHRYDVDWALYTTFGRREIDRVDRQGVDMPPNWGKAYVSEPFVEEHRYTNYLLANPNSVLRRTYVDIKKFEQWIPNYPHVYDEYKADHFISTGVPTDHKTWNWLMNEMNKDLGSSKQVNILLLFVPLDDPQYALALADKWIGGKKNDVIIVIGTKAYPKIDFVDVISWTPREDLKVDLRDALLEVGDLGKRDEITNTIKAQIQTKFVRMEMAKYEYLTRSFQPSRKALWWLFGIGTILSIGGSIFSVMNEETRDSFSYKRVSRRYY